MRIKAIPTAYKGYFFRSRLEARRGVFFDALGLKWEYEPEGFHLSTGQMYLPDFFLPGFEGERGVYVEVKPERVIDSKVLAAIASARSARFEHGQSGAML